ncbi:MAG: LamG domain-containing protein [Candidatus Latescibacterota bacterium]
MKSWVWVFALFLSFAALSFAQNGGYALKFDGTDDAVSATMNTGNTNSTMTLEFWFTQVTTQVGTKYLADFRSISGTNNRRVMPFLNSGAIGIFCAPNTGDDTNAVTQSTGITASANKWYHVAVTINGSTIKMYVNGKQYISTSLTDSYALTGTEILTLANDYLGAVFANVKIDEVRVWSSERTEAQIKANMFKELSGAEAGLLSYYKMSDGAGAALSDNQTAGLYAGTLSGGTIWTVSGAFADSRNGLDFDGSNDYVDCGNSVTLQRSGTQSFTVEAWVKPTGGVWVAVASKFVHTATNEGYSLEIFSDNKVALLYGNNWGDWTNISSNAALTAGVRSHIAATYDGSVGKVYINGRLDASASWANGVTDSGTSFLIGSRSGTTFYIGQLDEVRMWTVARTETQIRESMCRTLVGNEANLAAYYRLDQIDGTTTYDITSNANNGTLTNMDPANDWVTSDAFDTWIGGESTSWATAGNWSKGAVPTTDNSAGIYKWTLGNEAAISGTPTVKSLLVSSTSSPTLNSALTVNGNLVLEKNFDLNG